jgi:hypothetical protein
MTVVRVVVMQLLTTMPTADSCWRPGVGATEIQSPMFDAETVDEESDRLKSADLKKKSLQVMLARRR